MQTNINEDIKAIALRLKRHLKDDTRVPFWSMFWNDLDTLLDLILEADSE